MTQSAKISLSPQELQLATDAGIILTKNIVMARAQALLGVVAAEAQQLTNQGVLQLPQEAAAIPPKIAKGENYKGLPWVMLDYPRYFSHTGTFAIRSMFWWGHYFTCCLHVGGHCRQDLQAVLENAYEEVAAAGWLVYTGNDEWQHDTATGYTPVAEMPVTQWRELLETMPFIKILQQWPLQEWEGATGFYSRCYNSLATITR